MPTIEFFTSQGGLSDADAEMISTLVVSLALGLTAVFPKKNLSDSLTFVEELSKQYLDLRQQARTINASSEDEALRNLFQRMAGIKTEIQRISEEVDAAGLLPRLCVRLRRQVGDPMAKSILHTLSETLSADGFHVVKDFDYDKGVKIIDEEMHRAIFHDCPCCDDRGSIASNGGM